MATKVRSPLAERLAGVEEIECVTPDLNGVMRGKVMTGEGFLSGRRLQLARGVLLQCIMGGYPPARFYGSDDGVTFAVGGNRFRKKGTLGKVYDTFSLHFEEKDRKSISAATNNLPEPPGAHQSRWRRQWYGPR